VTRHGDDDGMDGAEWADGTRDGMYGHGSLGA
jgi:hypothetical protein